VAEVSEDGEPYEVAGGRGRVWLGNSRVGAFASRHPRVGRYFGCYYTSMHHGIGTCPAAFKLGGVRYAASKVPTRKGRKGHLYQASHEHPPPTPQEQVRITRRRIEKAERDERVDLTLALTPVKTCVG
jgi:hypothetical protein